MTLPQHRMISNHIHQVHVADGFADDCEELIHRWLKTDMLTYETFCAIWKDMRFDLIFHGRPSGAEIGELSEEVIHIAKHYMVTNPDNFEEAVAGLFLVYGLLNTQPYAGFAPLRIVPEDVAAITRIETVARAAKRYDVLYILGSILTQGPVQYQAVTRERGMDTSIRKYLEGGTTGIDRVGVRPKGVFYRQTEELDLLRELNNITRRYVEAKKNVPGSSQSLNYSNENFATELDTSLKEIINGILEEGDEGNKKITDHYSKVQVIKEKAMRQTVDGVRFLQSANRVPETRERKSTKSTNEGKSKPTKKTGGPPKAAKRIKRRCTVEAHTYRNRKRTRYKKRRYISSESSESSLNLSQDESQDSRSNSDNDIEVRTELNLDDLEASKRKQGENMVDLEIESLPVLIATEQVGNTVEIEIIDQMNRPPNEEDTIKKQVDLSTNQEEFDETSEDSDDMVLSKLLEVKKERSNDKKIKNETKKRKVK